MSEPDFSCQSAQAFMLKVAEHAWNDTSCNVFREPEENGRRRSVLACDFHYIPFRTTSPTEADSCERDTVALGQVVLRKLDRSRKLLPPALDEKPDIEAMVQNSFLGMDPIDVRYCKPPAIPELAGFEQCLKRAGPWDVNDRDTSTCRKQSTLVSNVLNKQATVFGLVPYLGEGVHRRSHKLGDKCVLKLAVSAAGASANRIEYDAWKEIKATGNKDFVDLFVPIRRMGPYGAYLVAKKVVPLETFVEHKEMSYDEAEEIADQMSDRVIVAGGFCGDVHFGNVGIDEDGEYRILDYGWGVRCPVVRPEIESIKKLHEEYAAERLAAGGVIPQVIDSDDEERESRRLSQQPIPAPPRGLSAIMPFAGADARPHFECRARHTR